MNGCVHCKIVLRHIPSMELIWLETMWPETVTYDKCNQCYYPHTFRDSVSSVYRIFGWKKDNGCIGNRETIKLSFCHRRQLLFINQLLEMSTGPLYSQPISIKHFIFSPHQTQNIFVSTNTRWKALLWTSIIEMRSIVFLLLLPCGWLGELFLDSWTGPLSTIAHLHWTFSVCKK